MKVRIYAGFFGVKIILLQFHLIWNFEKTMTFVTLNFGHQNHLSCSIETIQSKKRNENDASNVQLGKLSRQPPPNGSGLLQSTNSHYINIDRQQP